MRKLFATLLLCLVATAAYSQDYERSLEVKFNFAATALTIYNPSIEWGFAPHSSLSLDYVGIYSGESWMGTEQPFVFSMGVAAYRFYLKRNEMRGFYTGAEVGADVFRMNKNNAPFIANDSGSNRYDEGYGVLTGMVFGYKWPVSRRLSLEVNASFGWHYAMHEVYEDGVLTTELNPTAEWIPYKAGVYLNYHLGTDRKSKKRR